MPTSINIPVTEYVKSSGQGKTIPPVTELEALLGGRGIEDDSTIVVYDDQNGVYSSRFLWTVEALGHRKMALFETNYEDYVLAGGPTDRNEPGLTTTKYRSTPRDSSGASADQIRLLVGSHDARILDTRDRVDFLSGHIEGATSMPWRICLGRGKIFSPIDNLRQLFKEHFAGDDVDVVTYCKDGMTSSHTYMALRLVGNRNVRLYVGGYAEWKARTDLPKYSELESLGA
jgi:thiosulfate/3-mercaptopyruvate sulfurtransferase